MWFLLFVRGICATYDCVDQGFRHSQKFFSASQRGHTFFGAKKSMQKTHRGASDPPRTPYTGQRGKSPFGFPVHLMTIGGRI